MRLIIACGVWLWRGLGDLCRQSLSTGLALHMPSGSVKYLYHWRYFRLPRRRGAGGTVSDAPSQGEATLLRHDILSREAPPAGGSAHMQGGRPGWRGAQTPVLPPRCWATPRLCLVCGQRGYRGPAIPLRPSTRTLLSVQRPALGLRTGWKCCLCPAEAQRRGLHGQEGDPGGVSRPAAAPGPRLWSPGDSSSAARMEQGGSGRGRAPRPGGRGQASTGNR